MIRTLAGLTSVLLAIGVIYCRMAISATERRITALEARIEHLEVIVGRQPP